MSYLDNLYTPPVLNEETQSLNEIGDTPKGMRAIDKLIARTKDRITNCNNITPSYTPNAKLGLAANMRNATADISNQLHSNLSKQNKLLDKLNKFQTYKMKAEARNNEREMFSKLPPSIQKMMAKYKR